MDGNFYIYTDLSALPVDEHEAYLAEGFGGVCTGGTAVIEVFSVSRQISKNDLVTVLPLQSVLIREVSPDFSMTFFKIDKTMFLDTMSSLGKITPDFFFYMRIFYWDFYVHFRKTVSREGVSIPLNSNKENIAFRFAMLVYEHYKQHKEMAFYADKLCITPQYLTRVIQEVNGQSARELLADHVVLEVKALLRDANLDIKDIVRQTGFSNQSSLSRFFRRHTGMSPTEYRRTIHIIR